MLKDTGDRFSELKIMQLLPSFYLSLCVINNSVDRLMSWSKILGSESISLYYIILGVFKLYTLANVV